MRKLYKILLGKAEGKRQIRSRRRRSENGIKIDVKEFCWEGV
jgi:hypothetical protein